MKKLLIIGILIIGAIIASCIQSFMEDASARPEIKSVLEDGNYTGTFTGTVNATLLNVQQVAYNTLTINTSSTTTYLDNTTPNLIVCGYGAKTIVLPQNVSDGTWIQFVNHGAGSITISAGGAPRYIVNGGTKYATLVLTSMKTASLIKTYFIGETRWFVTEGHIY